MMIPNQIEVDADRRMIWLLRVVFWAMAAIVGLAQLWSVRHQMYSDGMSYLQIAIAYLNGDWDTAINAYWSPLYSWILALACLILRPSPYWQVAVLHLVNYLCFLLSFPALDLLINELLIWKNLQTESTVPTWVLYLVGYSCLIFEGLSQVHIGNTSPDMLALPLTLAITALVFRISQRGGAVVHFSSLAVFSAALFLARTAFAPLVVVELVTIALTLRTRGRAWLKPVLVTGLLMVLLVIPFVAAISRKTGRFTIGEAGRLNYAWEVNTAPRFRHWQGQPPELGHPAHPTKLALNYPRTYIFVGPVRGTYPPWFDPAYWYEGIHPRFDAAAQARVLLVNASILLIALVRSPVFIPCLAVAFFAGIGLWWRRLLSLWPLLAIPVSWLLLYAMVYVERRYVASNILIVWLGLLVSIPLRSPVMRRWFPMIIAGLSVFFVLAYVGLRERDDLHVALSDAVHRRESVPNLQFSLARRIRALGIKPGDRVAYIGTSDNADWTRLDNVVIVGEVPVDHSRNRHLFNNTMVDVHDPVIDFWKSGKAKQRQVLDIFKAAGAKIVVTDGTNPDGLASDWDLVLPWASGGSGDTDPERSRYRLLT